MLFSELYLNAGMPDCSASDQSGAGIRGACPVPECCGTVLRCRMPECRWQSLLCQIFSGYPHQERCFPARTTLHWISHRPREWGRPIVTVYMFAIGSWLHRLAESIPVPKIIDPIFAKTRRKRSFCMTENEPFWACFQENWVCKFGHWAPLNTVSG
jgi:hypothetical protein